MTAGTYAATGAATAGSVRPSSARRCSTADDAPVPTAFSAVATALSAPFSGPGPAAGAAASGVLLATASPASSRQPGRFHQGPEQPGQAPSRRRPTDPGSAWSRG